MRRVLVCFVAADLSMNLSSIKNQLRPEKGGLSEILLLYDGKNPPWNVWSKKTVEEIKRRLAALLLDVEEETIDPTDYDSTFKKLHDLIAVRRKLGDEVIIDFSSTTNVAAAAVISAAILFGVEVYVLKPKEYILPEAESVFEKRMAREAEGFVEIPLPRFEHELTDLETQILKTLADIGGEVASVADLLRKLGMKTTESEGAKNRGKYTYHIRQLESRGLVRTQANKELHIELTKIGSLLARIK